MSGYENNCHQHAGTRGILCPVQLHQRENAENGTSPGDPNDYGTHHGKPSPFHHCGNTNNPNLLMLYTIAVILIVLWLLGLVSGYTMGAFIHILLVVAVVMILVNLISGRRSL